MLSTKIVNDNSGSVAYQKVLIKKASLSCTTLIWTMHSRSSHQRYSIKKAVLKNFRIFTGNKVAGLKACNFIKKSLRHRCFPMNIAKFLRTHILKNSCERLLLAFVITCLLTRKKFL